MPRHTQRRFNIGIVMGAAHQRGMAHLLVGMAHLPSKPKTHPNRLLQAPNLKISSFQVSQASHIIIVRVFLSFYGVSIGKKQNPSSLHNQIEKLPRVCKVAIFAVLSPSAIFTSPHYISLTSFLLPSFIHTHSFHYPQNYKP